MHKVKEEYLKSALAEYKKYCRKFGGLKNYA